MSLMRMINVDCYVEEDAVVRPKVTFSASPGYGEVLVSVISLRELREGRNRGRRALAVPTALLVAASALWAGASPSQAQEPQEQYVADFGAASDGPPDGWSSMWEESNWSVLEDPTRLRHEVRDSNGRSHALTWDEIGDDGVLEGDVEVHAVVQIPDELSAVTRFQFGLHMSGNSSTATNAYYADVRNDQLRLNSFVDGSFRELASTTIEGSFWPDTWYHVVVRSEGDELKAKIWPSNISEPEEWQVAAPTAGEHDSGRVGVLHFQDDAVNDWRWFSVGTGGAEAPRAPEDDEDDPIEYDPLLTGFENREGLGWTLHQEEQEFLTEIDEASDRVSLSQVGTSVEGRPINLARVGFPSAPTDEEIADGRSILILGSQHGREPAGREMALQLFRDLALTEDPVLIEQLSNTTLLVVPSTNPDGRVANIRENVNGVNLNRDHVHLTQPETQAMARVFREFKPDVAIDAHEMGSDSVDVMALWGRILNTDSSVHGLAQTMVEDYVFEDLEEGGLSTDTYGSGDDDRDGVLSNTGTLRHSLMMLTETSMSLPATERVDAQMIAAYSALRFQRENADEIETATTEAGPNRAADGENQEPFYMRGTDEIPPEPQYVYDPAPCGYTLTPEQVDELETQIDLFDLQTQTVNDTEVHVTMAQPMMTMVPFLMDPDAQDNLVDGEPVFDAAECPLGSVENTASPAISGSASVGDTLTAAPGEWEPADVTLSYQWLSDGEPIDGATDDFYELTEADEERNISVTVTGTMDRYVSASATSESVGPVEVDGSDGGDGNDGNDGSAGGDEGSDGRFAVTGSEMAWYLGGIALLLLIAGGTMLAARARHSSRADMDGADTIHDMEQQ